MPEAEKKRRGRPKSAPSHAIPALPSLARPRPAPPVHAAPRKNKAQLSHIDYSLGDKIIDWIERELKVPEGRLVGKPMRLLPEQKQFIRQAFRKVNGKRQVRRAILSVARKFGKTALIAAILLAFLCGPLAARGQNRQAYSAALTRQQAALIYGLAAKMVRQSARLRESLILRETLKEIFDPVSGNLYRALSADAGPALGLSPYLVLLDELGSWGAESALYDALVSGSGAHEDPIVIAISTQAPADDHILSRLIDDGLASGDPSVYVQLHCADDDADILDEAQWKKANPALGHHTNIEAVRELAVRADRLPGEQAAFRNFMLNLRRVNASALFSPDLWRAGSVEVDLEAIRGRAAWLGLDLASRSDLAALCVMVPAGDDTYDAVFRCFTPADTLSERAKRDRVPYREWVDAGWLTACPGNTISLEAIADAIADTLEEYDVQALGFDRWRIEFLKQILDFREITLEMVPWGQGFRDASASIEELETWLLEGRIRFGQNPVMKYAMASAVADMDSAGNRKLSREKSTGRFDPLAALLDAIGAWSKRPLAPSVIKESNLDRFLAFF